MAGLTLFPDSDRRSTAGVAGLVGLVVVASSSLASKPWGGTGPPAAPTPSPTAPSPIAAVSAPLPPAQLPVPAARPPRGDRSRAGPTPSTSGPPRRRRSAVPSARSTIQADIVGGPVVDSGTTDDLDVLAIAQPPRSDWTRSGCGGSRPTAIPSPGPRATRRAWPMPRHVAVGRRSPERHGPGVVLAAGPVSPRPAHRTGGPIRSVMLVVRGAARARRPRGTRAG